LILHIVTQLSLLSIDFIVGSISLGNNLELAIFEATISKADYFHPFFADHLDCIRFF
jgi:hypothetical protein